QFHDRLVDRVTGRLDDEDVLLADVLQDLDEDVLRGELEDLELARLGAEVAADLPGEVRVRVAVVDLELVRVQARRLPWAEGREGRHADLIRPMPVRSGPRRPFPGRHRRPWRPAPQVRRGTRRSPRPGRPRRGA